MLKITTNQFTRRRINALKKLDVKFRNATRDTLRDSEKYISSHTKSLMEAPKQGKIYTVYVSRAGRRIKRGRPHHASAPNEPFAWMSGATFRSLRRVVPRWNQMEVGFGTPQSAWEKTDRTVLKKVFYSQGFELELDRLHVNNMKRELSGA